jgi:hypothetical protein
MSRLVPHSTPCPILPAGFHKKDRRKGGKVQLSISLFLTVFLLAATVTQAQPTRADAEKDPVLKAMLTELDRSMSQLQLPGFAKPFFIQYRIEEVDDFETKAEFGASEGSGRMQAARGAGDGARGRLQDRQLRRPRRRLGRTGGPRRRCHRVAVCAVGRRRTRPTRLRSRPTRKSRPS